MEVSLFALLSVVGATVLAMWKVKLDFPHLVDDLASSPRSICTNLYITVPTSQAKVYFERPSARFNLIVLMIFNSSSQ
jgi:hypothetical protein